VGGTSPAGEHAPCVWAAAVGVAGRCLPGDAGCGRQLYKRRAASGGRLMRGASKSGVLRACGCGRRAASKQCTPSRSTGLGALSMLPSVGLTTRSGGHAPDERAGGRFRGPLDTISVWRLQPAWWGRLESSAAPLGGGQDRSRRPTTEYPRDFGDAGWFFGDDGVEPRDLKMVVSTEVERGQQPGLD